MKVLIEKTTEAVVSESINIGNDIKYTPPSVPITFVVSGTLAAGEEINFQYFDGTNWQNMKSGGSSVSLSVDNNAISLYAPAAIRLNKPATASEAGVLVSVVRGV